MKLKESSWKNRPKKARDILIVLVVFAVALISFLSLIANVDLSGTTMKYEERYIELCRNAGDGDSMLWQLAALRREVAEEFGVQIKLV